MIHGPYYCFLSRTGRQSNRQGHLFGIAFPATNGPIQEGLFRPHSQTRQSSIELVHLHSSHAVSLNSCIAMCFPELLMHSQLPRTNELEDGLEHNRQSEQRSYKSLSDLIHASGACQGQSDLCDPNAFLDYTLVPKFEDFYFQSSRYCGWNADFRSL